MVADAAAPAVPAPTAVAGVVVDGSGADLPFVLRVAFGESRGEFENLFERPAISGEVLDRSAPLEGT